MNTNKHSKLSTQVLTLSPALAFQPVTMKTDASSKGLGVCLVQNIIPVADVSRALTQTGQGYSQIEKEMLSVVLGCSKFRTHVYDKSVCVETDHKPLETVIQKPFAQTVYIIKNLAYNIQLEYIPGKKLLIPDAL